MATYRITTPGTSLQENALVGVALGIALSILLIASDFAFRKFTLRAFNITIIGLFIGYLMGKALVLIFNTFIDISSLAYSFEHQTLEMTKITLFLFGTYLGTIMTLKTSEELYLSIPFVRFTPSALKANSLLLDLSVLVDSRIIDAAVTGFFDKRLIIPRFLLRECAREIEIGDENSKIKAKKALDVVKRLETIEQLDLRFNDTDFPEIQSITGKLTRLAKFLDADILSTDLSRMQNFLPEGVRILNLHTLSNALKPVTQRGEHLKVKIQRQGKEPTQGIGYLEDGAMVVVNGGGKKIGDSVDTQVLSVKHTSSGRMIFCNACNEETPACEFFEGQPYEL